MNKRFMISFANYKYSRAYLYCLGLIKNYKEIIICIISLISLVLKKKRGKIVLIVEFNPFHGETLPGYVYYFQQLGYSVVVVTRYCTWHDSPFVRMEHKPVHYCMSLWGMRTYLKYHSKKYDYIFYNSAHLYLDEYRFYGRIRSFLGGTIIGGREGYFLIEHNLTKDGDEKYFNSLPNNDEELNILYKRTFLLTSKSFRNNIIPMLVPCNFGKVNLNHHLDSNKRIFIVIGNVSEKSRNFSRFFSSLRKIGQEEKFEVWIIGRVISQSIFASFPRNVKILGRLSFEKMYDYLEKADYFLPLLEPDSQHQYLDGCTSGSRQLILGFSIPAIINRKFSQYFGLDENSSLCYDNDKDFITIFNEALRLNEEQYAVIRKNIMYILDKINCQSLENLRKKTREYGGK